MITGELCKNCGHPDYEHNYGHCHWQEHSTAPMSCSCTQFVSRTPEEIAKLSYDEQRKLACANYLDVLPELISKIEKTTDSNGRFNGLDIVIHIPIGETIGDWVKKHIPKEKVEWVAKYLEERKIKKRS